MKCNCTSSATFLFLRRSSLVEISLQILRIGLLDKSVPEALVLQGNVGPEVRPARAAAVDCWEHSMCVLVQPHRALFQRFVIAFWAEEPHRRSTT